MKTDQVAKDRLRRMTARWHDADGSGHTYYLRPHQNPDRPLDADIADLIRDSDTGAVLLHSLAESHLVIPPFPIDRASDNDGWNVGPLHSLLDRPRRVLVILLRLGGFSIGIFDGEKLLTSKTDSPFVKNRHRKGGSSSGRFARRREGQTRRLLDKACEALRRQVDDNQGHIDNVITGGDRQALIEFEKHCSVYKSLQPKRLQRILNVPEPRLDILKSSPRLVYSSEVVTFKPAG